MDNMYNNYNGAGALTTKLSAVMKRVYVRMFLGLIVTAVVALLAGSSVESPYISFIANNSWAMWFLIIAELGLVIGISAGINKLSSPVATLLFYLFAIVNGLMLAPIFVVYTGVSIAKTFFITAGTFGAMSIYGYCTKSDLTRFGSFLFMALIGLIIVSLVNIFLHSNGLDWLITIVGLFIFIGLTAWDTQQIKRMAMMMPADSVGKLATIGALNLYLDFINMFLYLLRIFGDNNN